MNAIHILDFTFSLQEVVSQQTGLKVLIAPLKLNGPAGPDHTVKGVVFEAIGL